VLRGPHPRLWGALAGAPRSGGAKLALRETPPPPPASGEEFVPSPCAPSAARGISLGGTRPRGGDAHHGVLCGTAAFDLCCGTS